MSQHLATKPFLVKEEVAEENGRRGGERGRRGFFFFFFFFFSKHVERDTVREQGLLHRQMGSETA